MSEAFRTAAPPSVEAPATPVADPTMIASEHEASLFATYEDDQGHPFIADYLDIKTVWDKEASLSSEVKQIEGYIREEVSNGKIENSIKAAKKFIQELEKKAGVSQYESTNKKISRLLAYIDFRRKVDN